MEEPYIEGVAIYGVTPSHALATREGTAKRSSRC